MNRTDRTLVFAKALLWSRLRGRGVRQFALPIGLGTLLLATIVAASRYPWILTLTSESVVRELVGRYFTGVSEGALVVGLLFIQGPYLLSLFAAVIGLRVGETIVEWEVESGRFEQFLNLPYRPTELYQSFILGSLAITLLHTLVIAVIAVGGMVAILTIEPIAFRSELGAALYVPFLIPVPMALWATLVVVGVGLWSADGSDAGGIAELVKVSAIVPAFSGLAAVSVLPGIDILLVTLGLILFATGGVAVVSAGMSRWFTPERVLRG